MIPSLLYVILPCFVVLLSVSSLLHGRDKQFVVLSGIAILVFRSELILFYGPCLLYGLLQGSVRLRPALWLTAFLTAVSSVAMSVLIDSIFWRRVVWPEGIVFYYNTILNKSGDWGKSPFHWYFTSALPRALLTTTIMLFIWFPFALRSAFLSWRGHPQAHFQPTSTGLVLVGLIFVSFYSILPHKELRFIIYVMPIFNLAASILWNFVEHSEARTRAAVGQKGKRVSRFLLTKYLLLRFCVWLCYFHLLINLVGTAILLVAAHKNYPGGHALMRINEHFGSNPTKGLHIHICNLAAQTGVTRFLEEHPNWTYNKTEGIESEVRLLDNSLFTHLISEIPPRTMRERSDSFRPLFLVYGFDGINVRLKWTEVWQFLQFRTSPRLTVYERTK
ncbi:Mannosyltransferase [Fasciolopsis buskii]|uniref:Mannosyltransferase n=1 Tax=Fasciolopsis buskii TaxID=27845 RepID=A0A8E0RQC1_9TREM|nr:Mannosyltransferase [Fasciolopsis buski]